MVWLLMSPYYVYILRCADGTLYTGSTTDIAARVAKHNAGRGAKYTVARRPVLLVYSETHASRSSAQKREAQLKGRTRAEKERLIDGGKELPRQRGKAIMRSGGRSLRVSPPR